MNLSGKILLRSLLKPFFRENAGLILFLLFIMFAAVGHNNGVGLREYHYQLIRGMLIRTDMLLIVLTAWILYALRGISFVTRTLRSPEYTFLSEFARLEKQVLYQKLLLFQFILFLPVLSYAAIIIVIAWRLHFYVRAAGIAAVLVGLVFGIAGWYTYLFSNPGRIASGLKKNRFRALPVTGYSALLLRFVFTQKRGLFLFVKLFSAVMLWAVTLPLSAADQDLRMPVLLFGFAPLGHSVLLFQCREMEERGLGFYRGMAVSLRQRFLGYGLFYLLLFLPETFILILKTPGHLSIVNAILLFGLGYGLLLLLNSILFTATFKKSGFLKISCGIYLFLFIGVLSGILPLIVCAIWILAVWLFFRFYYRFETTVV